jgi:hypothetical protein
MTISSGTSNSWSNSSRIYAWRASPLHHSPVSVRQPHSPGVPPPSLPARRQEIRNASLWLHLNLDTPHVCKNSTGIPVATAYCSRVGCSAFLCTDTSVRDASPFMLFDCLVGPGGLAVREVHIGRRELPSRAPSINRTRGVSVPLRQARLREVTRYLRWLVHIPPRQSEARNDTGRPKSNGVLVSQSETSTPVRLRDVRCDGPSGPCRLRWLLRRGRPRQSNRQPSRRATPAYYCRRSAQPLA